MSKPQTAAVLHAGDRCVCPTGLRTPSRTTSLPFQQVRSLINASAFAETLPATPWLHITMVLDQSAYGVADARAYLALQGRILSAIRRFLHAKRLPAHHIWVREIGPRDGRAHSHLMLSAPQHLRDELAELIRQVGKLSDAKNNRAVEITPKTNHWTKEPDTKGLHTRAQRVGVLRDLLKTMAPKAMLDGVRIMPALGIDNRGQPPCTILGKRSGTSESLSYAARKQAGWRELESLPELRAALPTGAEARKERKRENQRRYRERKRDGSTAPMPPTPPPKPAWKAVADELPEDFFEEPKAWATSTP